jgi:Methyltransferase domain
MGSWLVKALVQRGIGALPNPHYWNELLQDRVTHSLDLTKERFEISLRNCQNHLEQLQRSGSTATSNSFSAFELGTGWFPTVSIGLFLCGAREVWTWDIAPFLTCDRLKLTIRRFLGLEQGQGPLGHFPALPERLSRLREVMALCESPEGLGPAETLERLGIYYRIGNASRSGLPPQSVDLIVSDVVFEYLSPEELFEILQEFRRIAAPDAVMSHTISLDDQYAAYDPGITQFNFLRFSDRAWRWLNNPIIPLNRLRVSDYRRVFSESGFQVVDETNQRGDPAELARTPLAARFRGYSVEDLLVIHTWLVAIPQHSGRSLR